MAIERIEVYVNDSAQPVQVLTQAPFKVKFDTRTLPDGEHTLKTITYYTNGTQDIKEIPFKVANTPGVLVQGLEEGKEVSGELDVTMKIADGNVRPQREKFPGLAYAISAAVGLLLVWGFFAINPGLTANTLKEIAAQEKEKAGDHGGGEVVAAVAVDAALLKEGETLYGQSCAGCHQATGAGLPGAFPALAGDEKLSDAKLIVSAVHRGKNAMPAVGAAFSDEQLAAVATYVRNSWGNKFGGVTPEQAAEYK
jgi:cytochrome c oxidase subunit II